MGRCRHDHVGSMSEPVPSELSGASRLAATALTARADIQTAADGVPVVRPPHCGRSRGDARRECSRPSGRIAPSDRAVPPTPGQSGPVFFRWRQAHGTVSFRSPGSCGSPVSHGVAQSAALPLARTSQIPHFSAGDRPRAKSRHSTFTEHPAQTALAAAVSPPRGGNHRSGSVPRQAASTYQAGRAANKWATKSGSRVSVTGRIPALASSGVFGHSRSAAIFRLVAAGFPSRPARVVSSGRT